MVPFRSESSRKVALKPDAYITDVHYGRDIVL